MEVHLQCTWKYLKSSLGRIVKLAWSVSSSAIGDLLESKLKSVHKCIFQLHWEFTV
jgi:hypothetical protein